MAATDLEFVNVHVVRQELNENRRWVQLPQPRVELVVATPSGRTRTIPLDARDVARMFGGISAIVAEQIREEANR